MKSSKFYRPELDGLRFFAFLLVFIHHALLPFSFRSVGALPSGFSFAYALTLIEQAGNFGMSLFFVLSAYLITELLLIEKARTGAVHIKDFYIRRILRIWPLYFFFIGLILILGVASPETFHISGGRLAAFLLLSANWYVIYHSFLPVELGTLWSISVEEQFYLVWPRLVSLGRGRRGILWGSAAFAAIAVVTLAFLGVRHSGGNPVWFNSFVEFLFFAVGAQIACHTNARRMQFNFPARVGLLSAGLVLWLVATATTHIMQQPGGPLSAGQLLSGYLMDALATTLLFLSVLGISPSAVPQWLRYLGKISYGLYVYHMLMFRPAGWITGRIVNSISHGDSRLHLFGLLNPALAFVFTLIAAALSYRFLESPFLRLRRRFTLVASRPV